ncbi:ATP-binding protein [Inhella sp.]|uniref:sensor histidine kinase n=1 Tax=Inhella sp. TaxID=1921806 RepID=UPI0035B24066
MSDGRRTVARWAWTLSLLTVAGASGMLAYLLSIGATTPSGFFDRHQAWLYWVNLGAGLLLGLVVLGAALRLAWRVRRGRFGAQLLGKMALVFAVVAAGPGAFIYAVSYSFVERSIESWFDVRLASALEAGLNLGRATLDERVQDLAEQARQGAQQLAQEGSSALQLERLRERLGAERVALLGASGQVLSEVRITDASPEPTLGPERVDAVLLRRASRDGVTARIDGLDEEATNTGQGVHIRALALLPATALSLAGGDRYLLVERAPPRSIVNNALAVQSANQAYQRRALERDGLRRMYLGTLTLVLVLAVFLALLLAIQLGNQLAKPLLLLADGMRQVAAGDLTRKPVMSSNDELGGLTRAFAEMTDQLGSARAQAETSLTELARARAELQTILDNLTAGVIVLDHDLRIVSANPSSTRILRQPLASGVGEPLERFAALGGLAERIAQRFATLAEAGSYGPRGQAAPALPSEGSGVAEDHWQQIDELPLPADSEPLTLLMRGAALPHQQWLLVFDDISEVVSAQRAAAWGEVARRLAHEIKNPLTPIQLSAERLQMRLASKLAEDADRAMLDRSVDTIVKQVDALKTLVNAFRDYARLPAAQLAPLDLNALVNEVMGLYQDAQDCGRLVTELDGDLPPMLGDPSQLRQVIHNLVQNGLDAVSERPDGRVVVATRQSRAEDGSIRALRLTLSDNGPGFADAVLRRAFEPYVTTKSKGTGLGLAVVKKIIDEHGARIQLSNLPPLPDLPGAGGARVSLTFPKLA